MRAYTASRFLNFQLCQSPNLFLKAKILTFLPVHIPNKVGMAYFDVLQQLRTFLSFISYLNIHISSMIRISSKFLPIQTQIQPSLSKEHPKSPPPSIALAGCERITRARYPCLFILIQSWRKWCKYSLLHTLKKKVDQKEIEWVNIKQENMRNEYSKGSTRKTHSNTAEDHHRQLYENLLLYYLFWHRSHVCMALEESSRLYQTLLNQCYHVCCVYFCKKSLCCELEVLKELKCMLGGSIDFDPLKFRVMNHFCHYKQLQDPLVKLETIASINLISKDLDGLLNHFCTLSSQEPPSSEKPTNYEHLPSKFDIDPEYFVQFFKEEEEENESQNSDSMQNHLRCDFIQNQRQMPMIRDRTNGLIVISTNTLYEEMLEEFDHMYN